MVSRRGLDLKAREESGPLGESINGMSYVPIVGIIEPFVEGGGARIAMRVRENVVSFTINGFTAGRIREGRSGDRREVEGVDGLGLARRVSFVLARLLSVRTRSGTTIFHYRTAPWLDESNVALHHRTMHSHRDYHLCNRAH